MNIPKIIGKIELPHKQSVCYGHCHSCNEEFSQRDLQETVWINKEKVYYCTNCYDDLVFRTCTGGDYIL